MLWGAGTALADGSDQVLVDGVLIVRGPAAARWRAALLRGEPMLGSEQVEQAWSALDRHARRRDDRDPEPLPPSLGRLAARTLLVAAAAAAGFLVAATLLTVVGSLFLWAAGCVLLAVAAAPLYRWQRTRPLALAWQTGIGAALSMVAIAALIDIVR